MARWKQQEIRYCPRCNCEMDGPQCSNHFGGCHYKGDDGKTRSQVISDAEGYKLGDWQKSVGIK